MKKSLLLLLVLIMALTPALAGCQGKTGDTDESASPTIPIADEKHIYVWWESHPDSKAVINTAIVEFFEQNQDLQEAGYNIEAYTPASMDRNALEINIAGGTAPQIVKMDHVYISALGSMGNLENLLDPRFNFGEYEDKFIPSTWEGVKYKEDKIFGMPFDANTIALMYNKDLLNQAGKSVPKTYDEFIDVAQAIKSLNRDNTYGTTISFNDRNNWSTFCWLFWLWRMGGEVLNDDYTEARFNEQPGIDALNMYIKIINDLQLAPNTGYAEGEFDAGNIGLIEMGHWKIGVAAENPNFDFAPMVTLKDGVPNHSGLGLFAISIVSEAAGNPNVDLSYKFALHLSTTPKYQIDFCKPHNLTPSLIEAAEHEYFNDDIHKVFVYQLKIAKARPGVACWPQIEEAIHNAINQVLLEGRSATEALNSAAAIVNQLLASENASHAN